MLSSLAGSFILPTHAYKGSDSPAQFFKKDLLLSFGEEVRYFDAWGERWYYCNATAVNLPGVPQGAIGYLFARESKDGSGMIAVTDPELVGFLGLFCTANARYPFYDEANLWDIAFTMAEAADATDPDEAILPMALESGGKFTLSLAFSMFFSGAGAPTTLTHGIALAGTIFSVSSELSGYLADVYETPGYDEIAYALKSMQVSSPESYEEFIRNSNIRNEFAGVLSKLEQRTGMAAQYFSLLGVASTDYQSLYELNDDFADMMYETALDSLVTAGFDGTSDGMQHFLYSLKIHYSSLALLATSMAQDIDALKKADNWMEAKKLFEKCVEKKWLFYLTWHEGMQAANQTLNKLNSTLSGWIGTPQSLVDSFNDKYYPDALEKLERASSAINALSFGRKSAANFLLLLVDGERLRITFEPVGPRKTFSDWALEGKLSLDGFPVAGGDVLLVFGSQDALVQTDSEGRFSAIFSGPSLEGQYWAQAYATHEGLNVVQEKAIAFSENQDQLLFTITPESIAVDGASFAELTVTARDLTGAPLVGADVVFTRGPGTTGGWTDAGGNYVATPNNGPTNSSGKRTTYYRPTEVQNAEFTVYVDGKAISGTLFAGADTGGDIFITVPLLSRANGEAVYRVVADFSSSSGLPLSEGSALFTTTFGEFWMDGAPVGQNALVKIGNYGEGSVNLRVTQNGTAEIAVGFAGGGTVNTKIVNLSIDDAPTVQSFFGIKPEKHGHTQFALDVGGDKLVTTHFGDRISVRDAYTFELLGSWVGRDYEEGGRNDFENAENVAISHDGKWIVTALTGVMTVFSTDNFSRLEYQNDDNLVGRPENDIDISPTGTYIAAIDRGGDNFLIYNRNTSLRKTLQTIDGSSSGIEFSPNGNYVAYTYREHGDNVDPNYLKIYSVAGLSNTATVQISTGTSTSGVGWSPDSTHVAVGISGTGRSIRVFTSSGQDATTYASVIPVRHSPGPIRWSPDGKYIATHSENQGISIFDARTGVEVAYVAVGGGDDGDRNDTFAWRSDSQVIFVADLQYETKVVAPFDQIEPTLSLNWGDGIFQTKESSVTVSGTVSDNLQLAPGSTSWTIDGGDAVQIDVAEDGSFSFEVPLTGSHAITVSSMDLAGNRVSTSVQAEHIDFWTYAVEFEPTLNGTLRGQLSQTVIEGSSTSPVEAIANPGFEFMEWSNGGKDNPLIVNSVTSDLVLKPSFRVKTSNVNYSSSEGGSVSGDVSQLIVFGGNSNPITAVPDEGYRFVRWSDGSLENPRFDDSVVEDFAVQAEFERKMLFLQFVASEGGRIDGEVFQSVYYDGDALAVTAVPEVGFEFSGWSDNTNVNPRVVTGATESRVFRANFALMEFDVEYAATTGGSIQGEFNQKIKYGGSAGPVTAVADDGYYFLRWSDGLETPQREDAAVVSDFMVEAIFEESPYVRLSQSGMDVSHAGGSGAVKLETNQEWVVANLPSWAEVSLSSGSGDATLTFTVSRNTEITSRSAEILVGGMGLLLSQEARPLAAPVFEIHPETLVLFVGNNARFFASVEDAESFAGAVSIQWQESTNGEDWNDIADSKALELVIGPVTASMDEKRFRCVAKNQDGETSSEVAAILIAPTPLTEINPMGGDSAKIDVQVDLSRFHYSIELSHDGTQWSHFADVETATQTFEVEITDQPTFFRVVPNQ
jgi:hypothetical protein